MENANNDNDGDAQDGSHTPVNRLIQPWFRAAFFDTGHPCYGQLTPVKTKYLLTSITWSHRGLKFRVHRGHVLFWSGPLIKCWFSIGLWVHVRLTCCKQAGLSESWLTLKIQPNSKFFFYSTVFIPFSLCILRLFKFKTDGQTIYRNPHYKVTKLKIFLLSCVSLIVFWKTLHRSSAFRLG